MVKNKGGNVFQGDVINANSIKGITKNIHTVISALGGNNEVLLDGQRNLLDDALKNGVKRFLPSDYSFDIWKFPMGTQYFFDQRLKFKSILDKSNIGSIHVSNGMFMETFLYLNKERFSFWKSLDTLIDLTAQEDVAKYVAAAVSNPNFVGHLKIVGDERRLRDYIDIFNKVTGKSLPVVNEGSLGDLCSQIIKLKNSGDTLEYIKLSYLLAVFDGTGKIMESSNWMFSDIKPMSFEEFMTKKQGKLVLDYSIPEGVTKAKQEIINYVHGNIELKSK